MTPSNVSEDGDVPDTVPGYGWVLRGDGRITVVPGQDPEVRGRQGGDRVGTR